MTVHLMRAFILFVLLAFAASYPAAAGDPFAGRKVWNQNGCANCHGADGIAVVPRVPNFARGERLDKSDSELIVSIANGVKIMPAWKGILSRTDMINVIAFVRTFQR